MPEILTLVCVDEDSYELESAIVPASREALRAMADVALVQDGSCEYVVTLSGDRLTLWNPELVYGDQAHRRFQGDLEEALTQAKAWLGSYLGVEEEELEALLWPEEFH